MKRVWLLWINICHCRQKYCRDFANVTNVWWVNNIDGHFSNNHILNRFIFVLLTCAVMFQNCMRFFYLSLTQWFFLVYIELLLRHLVRWSSLDSSLQLQVPYFFHIGLYLRCFGGSGCTSDNIRFISDVK